MTNVTEKNISQNETPRVRTYERDVAEFMERTGGTAAHIALAEQERRIETREKIQETQTSTRKNISRLPSGDTPLKGGLETPTHSPIEGSTPQSVGRDVTFPVSVPSPTAERTRVKARSLVLWSVLFIVLAGVVGGGYWYLSALPPQEPAVPAAAGTAKIILADKEKDMDASRLVRDTFIAAFSRERAATLALSSFTAVVPTKVGNGVSAAPPAGGAAPMPRALTASEFLSLLGAHADAGFVRALSPQFTLGLRGLPTNRAFLIFKTNYFQTALAGMLQWEASLVEDLGPLFGNAISPALSADNSDAFTNRVSRFVDTTIKNRDVREFPGADGAPLLLWGFADKNTIIVADNEDTFQAVLGKLVALPQ